MKVDCLPDPPKIKKLTPYIQETQLHGYRVRGASFHDSIRRKIEYGRRRGAGSRSIPSILKENPKVKIEPVPDPENPTLLLPTYGYQAKFAGVTDRAALLAQVNRCPCGVGLRDLQDSCDGALQDAAALWRRIFSNCDLHASESGRCPGYSQ